MNVSLFAYEIVGHAVVTATFLILVIYALASRRVLRRTVRRAAVVYWALLAAGTVSFVTNLTRLVSLLRGREAGIPATVLDVASEYGSMIALSLVVVLLIGMRVIAERRELRPWRILVIGAHPDDIEIACGASMARLHDSGHIIWGLIMTQGERGGNAAVRPAEAQKGASFLGLDHVKVQAFPDTRLSEASVEMIAAIEEQIASFKPDMIFTHSFHDLHQDHRAVHEATLRAARNHGTIFCYESPSVTPEFAPTVFVDVSAYVDVKVESIKEHWDQRDKPYVHGERVQGIAVFRGAQAKLHHAEAFEVVRANFVSLG